MDYTKVPRGLIYKERNDLKEFGVQIPETMNYLLFLRLKQQALMGAPCAREIALRCYNNAYYVCTLILLEANDFPELRIPDYVETILEIEKGNKNIDEVCLASMAMACLLLARYDSNNYGKDSEVWKAINYRCTHYQWYNSSATAIFLAMMSSDNSFSSPLSPTEFAPRDVIELIENDEVYFLIRYHEYICERLALLEDQRQRMYWANKAIAHLKDDLQEIYEDYGYDPKTDSFEPAIPGTFGADPGFEEDFERVCKPVKEALAYFEQQYKKNVVEVSKGSAQSTTVVEQPETSRHTPVNKTLQERIKVLEEEITRLQTKVAEAQQKNGELTSAKESVETRYNELLHQLEPDEKLDESTKLGIDERVIFISTALGLTLDKGDTNQTQLAKFISIYSGDDWKSIRSRIVNINKELAQERETPGNGLSQGTKDAVKNVKDWLGKIGREIAPATKRIISEIDDIYLNKKE